MKFVILCLLVCICLSGCGGDSGGGGGHTAKCSDGSYSDSKNCSGTCSGHGGVSVWYTSSCGNSKTVANAVVHETSNLTYPMTNGIWEGDVRWHQYGQVQQGVMHIVLQDEKVATGQYEVAGENYELGGNFVNGFLTLQVGHYEVAAGDLMITEPNHLQGFYNVSQRQGTVEIEKGILQLDLWRR